MTDENQPVARPLFLEGRYLLSTPRGMIEIVPSGRKRRNRVRWWRAVLDGEAITDWLSSPRIVHHALSKRGF